MATFYWANGSGDGLFNNALNWTTSDGVDRLTTGATVNTGSVASGTYQDTWSDNGVNFEIDEVVGTPGFDVELTIGTLQDTPDRLKINGHYQGNPAHVVNVDIYNHNTASWDNLGTMASNASEQSYDFDISSDDYNNSGIVTVRFYHASPGTPTHKLYLDHVYITDNAGGAGIPSSSDDVYFHSIGNTGCRLDVSIDVNSLNTISGYTSTIDGATDDLDHSIGTGGVVGEGGTLTMGNGTWTNAGDWDVDGFTCSPNSSTLKMTGTGKTIYAHPTTEKILKLTIDTGATISLGTSTRIGGALNIDGTLTIDSPYYLYCAISGAVNINTGGELTGTGQIRVTQTPISTMDGTASIDYWQMNCGVGNSAIPSGTYDCIEFDWNHSNNSDRTFTLGANVTITGELQIGANSTGNLLLRNDTNNPTLVLGGISVTEDSTGTVVWTKGTGTITFTGSGTQNIDFNGLSVEDIVIDSAGAVEQLTGGVTTESFTMTAGTFDANGEDITVSGDIGGTGGDVLMGEGTWTLEGNWDSSSWTSLSYQTSTLTMTGVGKTIKVGTHPNRTINNLNVSGSVEVITNTLYINGLVNVTGTLTISVQVRFYSSVEIEATGTITGNGQALFQYSAGKLTKQDGVFSCSDIEGHYTWISVSDCSIGVLGGSVKTSFGFSTNRIWVVPAGTLTFLSNVEYELTGAGNLTVNKSTNDAIIKYVGNLLVDQQSTGILISTDGNGYSLFADAGSGTQTINTDGNNIGEVIINDAGAVKQLTGNSSVKDITVTAGTFDPNGFDLTTVNDFTAAYGSSIEDPIGSTITVGGNASITGAEGDLYDLVGSGAWYMNVTGTFIIQHADVAYLDASGGETADATIGCTNSGDNINVNFSSVTNLVIVGESRTIIPSDLRPVIVGEGVSVVPPE